MPTIAFSTKSPFSGWNKSQKLQNKALPTDLECLVLTPSEGSCHALNLETSISHISVWLEIRTFFLLEIQLDFVVVAWLATQSF